MIVCDASPLIALSSIDRLPLLERLAASTGTPGHVLVPPAVYHEVVVKGAGEPGADAVADARWIEQRQPDASDVL